MGQGETKMDLDVAMMSQDHLLPFSRVALWSSSPGAISAILLPGVAVCLFFFKDAPPFLLESVWVYSKGSRALAERFLDFIRKASGLVRWGPSGPFLF